MSGALWINLVEMMREIAHKEIVQKPQHVSDCWQLILAYLKIYFPDVKSLHQLYSWVFLGVKTSQRRHSIYDSQGLIANEWISRSMDRWISSSVDR